MYNIVIQRLGILRIRWEYLTRVEVVGLICYFEYQGCEAEDEIGRGFKDVIKKKLKTLRNS